MAGARSIEGYAIQPTVVPSGTRMFYLARTKFSRGMASGELWSVDLGSGDRQRALPGLVMANYSLSEDGSKVVFTSAGTERRDGIWIAPLDRRSARVSWYAGQIFVPSTLGRERSCIWVKSGISTG